MAMEWKAWWTQAYKKSLKDTFNHRKRESTSLIQAHMKPNPLTYQGSMGLTMTKWLLRLSELLRPLAFSRLWTMVWGCSCWSHSKLLLTHSSACRRRRKSCTGKVWAQARTWNTGRALCLRKRRPWSGRTTSVWCLAVMKMLFSIGLMSASMTLYLAHYDV